MRTGELPWNEQVNFWANCKLEFFSLFSELLFLWENELLFYGCMNFRKKLGELAKNLRQMQSTFFKYRHLDENKLGKICK
jgi:hypothetical protein